MPFEDKELNEDGTPKTVDQNQGGDPTNQSQQAQKNDHNTVFLVAGERAFGDAEAVVKKIENADSHIATLEAEGKVNREALEAATAEITRLKKIEDGLDGRQNSGNDDQTGQMSIEEVAAHAAKLAVGAIAQNETVAVQNQNLASAETKAKAAYGDDYVNKISEIAKSLNMSLKAVDELGKSSPNAFDRLFIPASPGTPHQPTNSSVNAPANNQQNSSSEPVNIVKMRERDRMSTVASRMKDAGVPGY